MGKKKISKTTKSSFDINLVILFFDGGGKNS